jgi:hypothetical protein
MVASKRPPPSNGGIKSLPRQNQDKMETGKGFVFEFEKIKFFPSFFASLMLSSKEEKNSGKNCPA